MVHSNLKKNCLRTAKMERVKTKTEGEKGDREVRKEKRGWGREKACLEGKENV